MGILQARILEWVAIPSSRGSPQPKDQTCGSPVLAGGFFTTEPPGKSILLVGVGMEVGAVKGKGSWHSVCR